MGRDLGVVSEMGQSLLVNQNQPRMVLVFVIDSASGVQLQVNVWCKMCFEMIQSVVLVGQPTGTGNALVRLAAWFYLFHNWLRQILVETYAQKNRNRFPIAVPLTNLICSRWTTMVFCFCFFGFQLQFQLFWGV